MALTPEQTELILSELAFLREYVPDCDEILYKRLSYIDFNDDSYDRCMYGYLYQDTHFIPELRKLNIHSASELSTFIARKLYDHTSWLSQYVTACETYGCDDSHEVLYTLENEIERLSIERTGKLPDSYYNTPVPDENGK